MALLDISKAVKTYMYPCNLVLYFLTTSFCLFSIALCQFILGYINITFLLTHSNILDKLMISLGFFMLQSLRQVLFHWFYVISQTSRRYVNIYLQYSLHFRLVFLSSCISVSWLCYILHLKVHATSCWFLCLSAAVYPLSCQWFLF